MTENTDMTFHVKHGRNTTDRMVPDLLQAIADLLNRSTIKYNGRECKLRQLGDKVYFDGDVKLVFDVLNPDNAFDHVEFCIKKTGWGRKV